MSNDNNSAFPWVSQGGLHNHQVCESGLTKRELFAAMAMQGLCSNNILGIHRQPDRLTVEAVTYADALLAELAK